MTDLRELLDTVAGEPAAATSDVVSSDVRRGRAALRRRRGVRATAGLVLAGAAVAVGVAVVLNLGGGETTGTTITAPGSSADAGVALVPWEKGGIAKPIDPALVPQGWWNVASTEAALVIWPTETTSPDDFRGKLVAMLAGDSTAGADARLVIVGGEHGTVSHEGGTTILLFPLPDGRMMSVQAPQSLHWDTATLVRFAEGLTVSPGAPTPRG